MGAWIGMHAVSVRDGTTMRVKVGEHSSVE